MNYGVIFFIFWPLSVIGLGLGWMALCQWYDWWSGRSYRADIERRKDYLTRKGQR